MLLNPLTLRNEFDRIEEIEKSSLRMVVQALLDFRLEAASIFEIENDLVADIGEDLTREALDGMGMSSVKKRLFGKVDYKRARYIFNAEYAVKQALFVDSKAEKYSGRGTATIQTSQFSMTVHQRRGGELLIEKGKLPVIIENQFLATTIFVKYNYENVQGNDMLVDITVVALPNGLLQEAYNLNEHDTIFLAGRSSPSRGEDFRVRINFKALKEKANWRVQNIPLHPEDFIWED